MPLIWAINGIYETYQPKLDTHDPQKEFDQILKNQSNSKKKRRTVAQGKKTSRRHGKLPRNPKPFDPPQ